MKRAALRQSKGRPSGNSFGHWPPQVMPHGDMFGEGDDQRAMLLDTDEMGNYDEVLATGSQPAPIVHQDFFNKFEDDFDDKDLR